MNGDETITEHDAWYLGGVFERLGMSVVDNDGQPVPFADRVRQLAELCERAYTVTNHWAGAMPATRDQCWALADGKPARTFADLDGSPYLTRYLLAGELGSDAPKVLLHHFHRGDADRDLHNHPWAFATAYVLVGGYVEFRRRGVVDIEAGTSYAIDRTEHAPGSANLIMAHTYHRVELIEHDCWTLLVAGPKVNGGAWGFWIPETGEYVPHEKYREFTGRAPDASLAKTKAR